MKIEVKVKGLDALRKQMVGREKQIRFAAAKALTTTAHAVRTATVKEMESVLDRPKPFTTKQAIQVIPAKKETLTATVGVGVKYDAPSKGTSYTNAIGHLFTGGARSWKKMEGAFRRIGALPSGWIMVPGKGCELDQYGNVPRGFVVQMITYFNASTEQGYKANMTEKRRSRLAKAGRTKGGYKVINGVQYFISYGKRGKQGDSYTNGRFDQHLPAGIWSRSGIHGVSIKPIFLFVRMGTWKKYIDLHRIAENVVGKEFDKHFNKALADALRTAR